MQLKENAAIKAKEKLGKNIYNRERITTISKVLLLINKKKFSRKKCKHAMVK